MVIRGTELMLIIQKLKLNFKLIRELDFILIFFVMILSVFGLMNIYSVTNRKSGYYFFDHQMIWILISIFIVYVILCIDYSKFICYIDFAYWFNVALLVYTYLFTHPINGAKVWIQLGSVAVEPGEFCKLTITLMLAKKIQEMNGEINNFKNLCTLFIYSIIPTILILIAPDLGLVLIVFFTVLSILFICKLDLKMMLSGLLVLVVFVTVAWNFGLIKEYQKQRLTSFISQDSDLSGTNLQVSQSKIAIGSGGLMGQGFNKSTYIQGDFIPESHTDFIFAVVGSEWGLSGTVALLAVYAIVMTRIIKIGKNSKDVAGTVICIGSFGALVFSILQNIGMTVGIMPITGITLPFISYGGSSALCNFVAIGLILNVGMRRKKINF